MCVGVIFYQKVFAMKPGHLWVRGHSFWPIATRR